MESDEILTARTMPHPDRDREPKYCWACGMEVYLSRCRVFWTPDAKRAFVHHQPHYINACESRAIDELNAGRFLIYHPSKYEGAERRKGMLY